MLTPKQHELLSKLQKIHPYLFSRLELHPVESPEYRLNQKIEARVSDILNDATKPLQPRTITKPRKPWDTPSPADLSNFDAFLSTIPRRETPR